MTYPFLPAVLQYADGALTGIHAIVKPSQRLPDVISAALNHGVVKSRVG